jgi:hypothetical protein
VRALDERRPGIGGAFSFAFPATVARNGGMTRRSRRLLLLALPIALALSFAIVWVLWPQTAITRENAALLPPAVRGRRIDSIDRSVLRA